MKKAFSLWEMIIVVLILAVIYAIFLPNFKVQKKEEKVLNIKNLKEYLLKQDFKDTLSFSCIQSSFDCFVFIDGKQDKSLTKKAFFKQTPYVYEYTKQMKTLEFPTLKLDSFEEFNVVFELKFNKKKRHKELIVEFDSGVYLFNNMSKEVKQYQYLSEILDGIDFLESEIKNAF